MPRIASLLPSATEIVCALGAEDQLVGRSHECDHPAGIAALPPLTRARLDAEAPSRAIDDAVKELVARGTSVYDVDADRLRALAPDVIVTQDHCEVCAASVSDLEAALATWVGGDGPAPRLVSLSPQTLGDVWESFRQVADALGVPERGRALTERLANDLTEIAERTQARPTRPRVACVEWLDPLMAAGNWVPELVALAGGENTLGEPGTHSPWLAPEALRDADPDVIVVMPCGFDLTRTRAELASVLDGPAWDGLRARRDGRIAIVDGNQYFNRPGPRLVDSLEILAEILHPEVFPPTRRGQAWEIV